MRKLIFPTLLLIALPNTLGSDKAHFFVEKWPSVIMTAGSHQYIMDEPGGAVRRVTMTGASSQSPTSPDASLLTFRTEPPSAPAPG